MTDKIRVTLPYLNSVTMHPKDNKEAQACQYHATQLGFTFVFNDDQDNMIYYHHVTGQWLRIVMPPPQP